MKNIILFFAIAFGLFFGTASLIMLVNGNKSNYGVDAISRSINNGFIFLVVLLCIVFSILIIILWAILVELKKLNSTESRKS